MKARRILSLGVVVTSLLLLFSVLSLYSQAGAAGQPAGQPSGPFPPSEPYAPIDRQQPSGPRPDEQEGVQQTWRFYHVPGTAFQPRDSATGYSYIGNGCIAVTNNPDLLLNTELLLPEGSTIKYLRLYYLNASALVTQQAWITRYEATTGGRQTVEVAYVASPPSAGYGEVLSAEVTHTVDLYPNSYVLNWRPRAATTNHQLCGMRVAYYAPPRFEGLLPSVRFDRAQTP